MSAHPRVAVACVLGAIVLVVLDAAIANVALPAIARALAASPAAAVRVVSAYQLALVVALLPCAALGERLGYRRVYTAGVALFTLASGLCAAAPSLPLLVAARFVQGLGGAAIMSLGVALLRLVVPPERLGAAIGWNALAVALASAAGPTVGAIVLSVAPWHWLFVVNLPLGALVLLATRAHPDRPGTASRERPRATEVIPLDLLRDASFRTSVVASVCCFVGQGAAMVALPFYLRHGLHQDALRTGLLITPWPLTVALVAPLAGRLADRVPGAWLCTLGGALLSLGLAGAALAPLDGRAALLVPCVVVAGAGFGMFQVPNNRNMLLAAPPARSGAAGAMQATARLMGQTLGALLMTLLFTHAPLALAPRLGLGAAAAFALAAGLVSTRRAPSRERSEGPAAPGDRDRRRSHREMRYSSGAAHLLSPEGPPRP